MVVLVAIILGSPKASAFDAPEPEPQEPLAFLVEVEPKLEVPKPKPVIYKVKRGDSLTKIARRHNTSVLRLFYKNKQIKHPDDIKVGLKLVIPAKNEELKTRKIPAIISVQRTTLISSGGVSSSGNTYYWGQCVWYIKNVVPWVQNGWGSAYQWKYTSGHRISPVPSVGTVAWARNYNHVALVIGVSGSSVRISEMNARGLGVISERLAPISEFEYIYP